MSSEPEDNMTRIIRENREFHDWFFKVWTRTLLPVAILAIGAITWLTIKSMWQYRQHPTSANELIMVDPKLPYATNQSVRFDELYTRLEEVTRMAEMMATNKPTMNKRIEQLSNQQFSAGLFVGFRVKELGGSTDDIWRFVHHKQSNRLDLVEQWFKERKQ